MTENVAVSEPAPAELLETFIADRQREADAAAAAAVNEETTVHHLVTFRLGKEEYGVGISLVQEIIRDMEITPIPKAPCHIQGVINLRGKIIPVMDLRRRLGLPPVTRTEAERIIVVDVGDRRVGMLVDAVSHVQKVPGGSVEELPQECAVGEEFISGIGRLDDRLIVILDVGAVFSC